MVTTAVRPAPAVQVASSSVLRNCKCGGVCPRCIGEMKTRIALRRAVRQMQSIGRQIRMDRFLDEATQHYRDTLARWARDNGYDPETGEDTWTV